MRIAPARDRTLDLAALGSAVRKGSARIVRMRIAADGVVETGAGGSWFRIAGWPVAYAIEGADLPAGPHTIHANVHFAERTPRLHPLAE